MKKDGCQEIDIFLFSLETLKNKRSQFVKKLTFLSVFVCRHLQETALGLLC